MQFPKIYILFIITVLAGCSRSVTLDHLFENRTPYEKYKLALENAQLHQTALGKDWLQAGEASLQDSLVVSLPYQENGYFSPEKPAALFLRYAVREGQNIHIQLDPLVQPDAVYFIDVFSLQHNNSLEQIHAADSTGILDYEVEESGWHAIRVQPELLRGGPFLLSVQFQPSLSFPVSGRNSQAVGSFFGDTRDGGQRSHKGIDIFAPKGTPVLAAASGVVGSAMLNRLGGKVVWLRNPERRFTQYYAHLDSQAVRPGQRVALGDTIGFVGNTGNARTTPPHLHFSIYKFGKGAVDPYPFVHALLDEAPVTQADSSELGIPARIRSAKANIRHSPSTDSEVMDTFEQYTLLNVEGKTGEWYRISLPDTRSGYIHQSIVESIEQPLQQLELTEKDPVYPSLLIQENMEKEVLALGTSTVYAAFDSLWYVQTAEGYYGWVHKTL